MNFQKAKGLQTAHLQTPTDLQAEDVREITGALNVPLAEVFALYLKTKDVHWHVSGPHFRDYHLLLDEHGDQIFAITDAIAEPVRKIGGMTFTIHCEIRRLQRIQDDDTEFVIPLDMLAELCGENKEVASKMRETHGLCEERNDVATADLLEVSIDEAELTVHVSSSRRCPSSATPTQLIKVGPAKGLGRKQIAPACRARMRMVSLGKAVMSMNGTP